MSAGLFTAWIIAPAGRGTKADAVRVSQWLEQLPEDRLPRVVWVRNEHGSATQELVDNALKDLAKTDGDRLVWILANAVDDGPAVCLKTDDRQPSRRLSEIGTLLKGAALARSGALVVVADVCNAAKMCPAEPWPRNLAMILACDTDEVTHADDRGGWLTLALLEVAA